MSSEVILYLYWLFLDHACTMLFRSGAPTTGRKDDEEKGGEEKEGRKEIGTKYQSSFLNVIKKTK